MNLDLLIQILYLFLISLIFAALEIQIEGENGWASNLPTWRPKPSGVFSKIYRLILFGKDVTGYHLLVFTLLLIILHYPFFTGKTWSLDQEPAILSYFFLLGIVWDFLWFLLNPHYGLSRFKKRNIWWHKRWFLFMPVDYWFGFMFSALFYVRFSPNAVLFKEWLFIVALFSALTILIIIFSVIKYGLRKREKI